MGGERRGYWHQLHLLKKFMFLGKKIVFLGKWKQIVYSIFLAQKQLAKSANHCLDIATQTSNKKAVPNSFLIKSLFGPRELNYPTR